MDQCEVCERSVSDDLIARDFDTDGQRLCLACHGANSPDDSSTARPGLWNGCDPSDRWTSRRSSRKASRPVSAPSTAASRTKRNAPKASGSAAARRSTIRFLGRWLDSRSTVRNGCIGGYDDWSLDRRKYAHGASGSESRGPDSREAALHVMSLRFLIRRPAGPSRLLPGWSRYCASPPSWSFGFSPAGRRYRGVSPMGMLGAYDRCGYRSAGLYFWWRRSERGVQGAEQTGRPGRMPLTHGRGTRLLALFFHRVAVGVVDFQFIADELDGSIDRGSLQGHRASPF